MSFYRKPAPIRQAMQLPDWSVLDGILARYSAIFLAQNRLGFTSSFDLQLDTNFLRQTTITLFGLTTGYEKIRSPLDIQC